VVVLEEEELLVMVVVVVVTVVVVVVVVVIVVVVSVGAEFVVGVAVEEEAPASTVESTEVGDTIAAAGNAGRSCTASIVLNVD
jgi:hypothetical protein